MSLALNTCLDHCRCETLAAQSSITFFLRHRTRLALASSKIFSSATGIEVSANGCELSHRMDGGDVESGYGLHKGERRMQKLLRRAPGVSSTSDEQSQISQWLYGHAPRRSDRAAKALA